MVTVKLVFDNPFPKFSICLGQPQHYIVLAIFLVDSIPLYACMCLMPYVNKGVSARAKVVSVFPLIYPGPPNCIQRACVWYQGKLQS